MTSAWHLGWMVAFDTETTSADVETARLVTACLTTVDGMGAAAPESRNWLVNPGVDIPDEATAVHGVTTQHARDHGEDPVAAVSEIAGELLRAAGGLTPIIAFNMPFDFTVLDRETRRLGMEPFGERVEAARAVMIDPYVIDKAIDPYRKGKRTLTAIAAHYGVKQDTAHSADGDAITAARVAWKIAATHPEIGNMSPTELHMFQVKAKHDQAASFRAYLHKQGRGNEPVDGSWPVRPWDAEAAA